jgi:hypothetical protein
MTRINCIRWDDNDVGFVLKQQLHSDTGARYVHDIGEQEKIVICSMLSFNVSEMSGNSTSPYKFQYLVLRLPVKFRIVDQFILIMTRINCIRWDDNDVGFVLKQQLHSDTGARGTDLSPPPPFSNFLLLNNAWFQHRKRCLII